MGRRRLLFAPELLINLTHGTFRIIANETPKDAHVAGAGYDDQARAVYIDVESEAYEGDGIGEPPVVQTIHTVRFEHSESVFIDRLP